MAEKLGWQYTVEENLTLRRKTKAYAGAIFPYTRPVGRWPH